MAWDVFFNIAFILKEVGWRFSGFDKPSIGSDFANIGFAQSLSHCMRTAEATANQLVSVFTT
jgi:hypothetical protein